MNELIIQIIHASNVFIVVFYPVIALFCLVNLWYNDMNRHIKLALKSFVFVTFIMLYSGIEWVVNEDYLKVPLRQEIGWILFHVIIPYIAYRINLFVCETSINNCKEIRESLINKKDVQLN